MSLKQKAIKGAKWTSISTITLVMFQLTQLYISIKILEPSALGLIAMVTIFVGFGEAFSDMGLTNSIIQEKSVNKKQLSSLYWINIICGLLVCLLILIFAPLISNFYNEPKLTEMLYWLSLIFIITPFGQQFQALLMKELKFNILSLIELVAASLSFCITILILFLQRDVLAIIYGQVINASIKTICLFLINWKNNRPLLFLNFKEVKHLIIFGMYQTGEKLIYFLNSNLDNIIIGRALGATKLGYYSVGNNITSLPATKLNPILTRVAFPTLSKIRDDQYKLRKGYLKLLEVINVINFPIFLGLFIISPDLIPIAFGEQWKSSIILVQLLCIAGLLRSIQNPIGSLLLSQGRADLGFKFNAIKIFTQLFGIILGIYYGGLIGVVVMKIIMNFVDNLICYYLFVRKMLGSCLKEYIHTMAIPCVSSIFMSLVVYQTSFVIDDLNLYLNLIVQILIGSSSYVFIYGTINYKKVKNIVYSRKYN